MTTPSPVHPYLRWWYELPVETQTWLQANPTKAIPHDLIPSMVQTSQPGDQWLRSEPGAFRLAVDVEKWVSDRPTPGKAVTPPRQPVEDNQEWLVRVRAAYKSASESVRAREAQLGPTEPIRPGQEYPVSDGDLDILHQELEIITEELGEAVMISRSF